MAAILTSTWAAVRVFRGPLGDALARRIAGTGRGEAQHEAERDAQLADMHTRLAELEERVDFAERMLLQERQQSELGPGGPP
jgi:hypothetical protein